MIKNKLENFAIKNKLSIIRRNSPSPHPVPILLFAPSIHSMTVNQFTSWMPPSINISPPPSHLLSTIYGVVVGGTLSQQRVVPHPVSALALLQGMTVHRQEQCN